MKISTSFMPYVRKLDLINLRSSKIINSVPSKYYFYLVFVAGSAIRLRQYFTSRSFWIDEAALAINIRDRSYLQLLEALDFNQVAPIGFLYFEKLITGILGQGELVFRLLPILASIASIWLIYKLFSSSINKEVALISSIIFIFSTTLTYYSSELKQYSSDIFFALLLIWLWDRDYSSRTILKTVLIGVIGGICLWFSNVLIVPITSIIIVELIRAVPNENRSFFIRSLPAFLIWVVSFGVYYYFFIYDNPHTEQMRTYWTGKFMPTNSFYDSTKWLWDSLVKTFRSGIGFYQSYSIPLYFFLGGILLSIFNKRKNLVYLIPILLHFVLSGLQIYPYDTRFILYLLPFYIVFISLTIDFLSKLFLLKKFSILITALLVFYGTGVYYLKAKEYFNEPYLREHIKPTLSYLEDHVKKDDTIYVYYGSKKPFLYYQPLYTFTSNNFVIGNYPGPIDDRFITELESLHGRVWILFSHMTPVNGIEYIEQNIIANNYVDYFEADGSKTYLLVRE